MELEFTMVLNLGRHMCLLKNIKNYYAILGEGVCHVGLQEINLQVEV